MSNDTQANDETQGAPQIAGQALVINTTPAALRFNYDQLKRKIEKHVEQYAIVVTEDEVSKAKQLATELNQQAKALDTQRKEAIKTVSAPIREADDQLKELVSMLKSGRQKILDQAKVFEAKRLDIAREHLRDLLAASWDDMQVRDEFRRAGIDDLVKLGALTKHDNLTRAARDEVRKRCRDDLALQERTERRLLELENHSYRAGLTAPLTRAHVEHVLMADDDAYKAGIERIIEAEQKRQEQIEAAARTKDARKAAEAQQQPPEQPQPAPAPPAPAGPAGEGRRTWVVTCIFNLETNARLTQDQIEAGARRAMSKAGITTLAGVTATTSTGAQDNG